jgi:hypothetical protein
VDSLRRPFVCALAVLTFGCGGADVVTTPTSGTPARTVPAPVPAQLVAVSAVTMSADPGWRVTDPPVVRVTDSTGTRPVPGVLVVFTVTAGGGAVSEDRATTDGDGLARAGSWQAGDTATTNTLVASVNGLGSVLFAATVTRRMIARFDLRMIGPVTLPYYVLDSTQAIIGGHYVLFDDGSATFGYDLAAVTPAGSTPLPGLPTPLRYLITGQLDAGASIGFYYAPGRTPLFHPFGDSFSFGQSLNGFMTVNPVDIDFDPEVYQRAK